MSLACIAHTALVPSKGASSESVLFGVTGKGTAEAIFSVEKRQTGDELQGIWWAT